jgi:hypothetical protein
MQTEGCKDGQREREMGKTFFWDTFFVELEVG